MEKNKGYLLPPGDAYTEDMECALVFYPDKPEYRRALLGSITYLATWIAWEKESEHKGIDAALSWKIALDKTLECWNMACIEGIQDQLTLILALVENNLSFCNVNISWSTTTVFVTSIFPESGDPPDYYGETAISDWDDWKEHVCFNAHAWIDELINTAETIETSFDVGTLTAGVLSGGLAALSFFVIGGAFPVSVIMIAFAALAAGITSNLFSDAADDIEDARDDIACALLQGTSLADAIEDALSSSVVWNLFYSLVDYDSAQAIIYEGGDGETFLDDSIKTDCECDALGEYAFTFDFDASTQGWILSGTYAEHQNDGYPDPWNLRVGTSGSYIGVTMQNIRNYSDCPNDVDEILMHTVTFWNKRTNSSAGNIRFQMRQTVEAGWTEWSYGGSDTWIERQKEWIGGERFDDQGSIRFKSDTESNYQHLDSITFRFDAL